MMIKKLTQSKAYSLRLIFWAARHRHAVKCPCCRKACSTRLSNSPLHQEVELERAGLTPWWADPGWSIESNKVQWACDDCLHGGHALAADPSKQLYCDFPPYLAYFDTTHQCETCGTSFMFSKQEQLFWYETRGFWVQSKPKQCKACRSVRRQQRAISVQVQKAIETLDETDPLQLAVVADLLLKAGSETKAISYLRRAKNLARSAEQRDALVKRLEELQM